MEVDSFSRTPNNLGAMETFCCFDGSPWVPGVARNSVWSEPAGPDGFAVAPAQSAGVTMTICELLLFALNSGYGGPVDLTAADVANVQSYLSKKWGV